MAVKGNFRVMPGGKGASKGKKNSARQKSGLTGGKGKSPSSGKKAGFGGHSGVIFGIAVFLVFVLLGAGAYVLKKYKVENITVEGNLHYTDDEIIEMVMKDRLSYNSLYLSLKYRNKEIKNIPFIETMNVRVVAPDTVAIMVYEKSVAGYVEYMGRYMYFDREGIVVESSMTRTEGIPQVTGVSFDHVVLYEPLPVENQEIFHDILSITQMLSKYEISTDKIYFNDSYEITLYFGGVRARLGQDNLEEKIMRLKYILPRLEGESGVLKMENYSEERENVTFEKDVVPANEEETETETETG